MKIECHVIDHKNYRRDDVTRHLRIAVTRSKSNAVSNRLEDMKESNKFGFVPAVRQNYVKDPKS